MLTGALTDNICSTGPAPFAQGVTAFGAGNAYGGTNPSTTRWVSLGANVRIDF
jgi:hypothetical protein